MLGSWATPLEEVNNRIIFSGGGGSGGNGDRDPDRIQQKRTNKSTQKRYPKFPIEPFSARSVSTTDSATKMRQMHTSAEDDEDDTEYRPPEPFNKSQITNANASSRAPENSQTGEGFQTSGAGGIRPANFHITNPGLPPVAGMGFAPQPMSDDSISGNQYKTHYMDNKALQEYHRRLLAGSGAAAIAPDMAMSGGGGGSDAAYMQKLNYIINLLEEQKHEKTDTVMEEVIMYSFLGIFMIFIADTFMKSGGKYVR